MTRRFSTEPLDPEAVLVSLDLARRVPSAGFAQGTSFLLLTGTDIVRLWEASGAGAWFAGRAPGVLDAPVVVVPLADPRAYLARYQESDKSGHGLDVPDGWPVPHWLTDTALAVQQLLLLAEDQGWGALYAGLFRNLDAVRTAFGIPPEVVPLGFVALGMRADEDVPSGSPTRRPRRPLDEVVHRGRWNGRTPSDSDLDHDLR